MPTIEELIKKAKEDMAKKINVTSGGRIVMLSDGNIRATSGNLEVRKA